ncbi:hypothetical protein DY000_02052300 [Brassica cretica]|uniref:Uncharacterized protein n=1 Tax=Brassica cretica TaxID=69181 RepID=A0ABQ7AD27_BRACR|nr:hypothetical protein DY000_02052300 [Brassica cretica]
MVVHLVQGRRLIGASATVSGRIRSNIECAVGSEGRLDTRRSNKRHQKMDAAWLGVILRFDQEASSLEPGHGVVCGTNWNEIEVRQEVMRDDFQEGDSEINPRQ